MKFKAISNDQRKLDVNWFAINAYTAKWKPGTAFEVEIVRRQPKRSDPLRSYYFAAVLPPIMESAGYEKDEILELHKSVIESSGGKHGVRDLKALDSAINQPRLTFEESDLYPDVVSKAGALCFFLIMNHPFIDGNKRVGHAAMETFLILNGYEIEASVEEQERIILELASGNLKREEFTSWLREHLTTR